MTLSFTFIPDNSNVTKLSKVLVKYFNRDLLTIRQEDGHKKMYIFLYLCLTCGYALLCLVIRPLLFRYDFSRQPSGSY